MFKTLLLPVDLSDRHGPAVRQVAELAGSGGGEVVLLHVIEVIAGLDRDEEQDFYHRLEKSARKHLKHLGASLDQRKVSWRAEVAYGNRLAEIVRYASDNGTDLIVLTAPKLDPTNPTAGWGSLSYRIGLLASCPVLLVK